MDASDYHTSDSTSKKRSNNGGIGLLDGLRRTFVNFLRHSQSNVLPSKALLRQKNMTLPLLSKQNNEFGGDTSASEHAISKSDTGIMQKYEVRRLSSFIETPEPVKAEFIRLNKIPGSNGSRNRATAHTFCAIPLELDTFCDYCNQPIWGLGWGPVCQRCADCHMTCHWLCKDRVTIPCEVSPPSARATTGDNGDHNCPGGDNDSVHYDFADNIAAEYTNSNEYNHVSSASRSSIKKALQSHQKTAAVTTRVVSMGADVQVLPVLANADGRLPNCDSPSTLRPHSQFSLFTSDDTTILKVVEGKNECQQPSPPQSKPMHHESLLQTRRRNHNRRSPTLSSRRHTTGVSLMSTTFDTYDISSLDHNGIQQRGISVWQLSPAITNTPSVVVSSRMQATQLAAVTGHQTGTGEITYTNVVIGPRDAILPWKPGELTKRLEVFNANDYGLRARMVPKLPPGDCEGQVRVHINLIRPVGMVLTARPPSIFHIVGGDDDGDECDDVEEIPPIGESKATTTLSSNEIQQQTESSSFARLRGKTIGPITSFRIPRGSSKLLHVHLSTNANQVISSLLARFNIDDNPQKFALYEHTIFGENEVSVRKLFGNESPLGLFLQWTLDPSVEVNDQASKAQHCDHFNAVLAVKRLVLQENETSDIEWSCFSEAELRTFLGILNREETDYRCRTMLKYQIRKREILRLMNLRAKCQRRTNIATTPTPITADGNIQKDEDDCNVTPTTDSDPATPLPPPLSPNDSSRTQDTECIDGGNNEVPCLPDFSPSPSTIAAADEITPLVNLSHPNVLSKAQHKKNAKLAKNKLKKLKSVKEKGAKPPKRKSHMWLKKKK